MKAGNIFRLELFLVVKIFCGGRKKKSVSEVIHISTDTINSSGGRRSIRCASVRIFVERIESEPAFFRSTAASPTGDENFALID